MEEKHRIREVVPNYGKGIAKVLKQTGAEFRIIGLNQKKLPKAVAEIGVHAICSDASNGGADYADSESAIMEIIQ